MKKHRVRSQLRCQRTRSLAARAQCHGHTPITSLSQADRKLDRKPAVTLLLRMGPGPSAPDAASLAEAAAALSLTSTHG